jgi:ribosome-associated heat shock protein Hsp15
VKPGLTRDRQRIDKWLWHARMVPTRSDAAALVEAGYVRVNGQRVGGASAPVRIGNVVTLALDRSVRVLQVEGFCEKRGASAKARALYRELSEGRRLPGEMPRPVAGAMPPPRSV